MLTSSKYNVYSNSESNVETDDVAVLKDHNDLVF